jgi:hypothetical protein
VHNRCSVTKIITGVVNRFCARHDSHGEVFVFIICHFIHYSFPLSIKVNIVRYGNSAAARINPFSRPVCFGVPTIEAMTRFGKATFILDYHGVVIAV